MKVKVGVAQCTSYEQACVLAAMKEAVERAGGVSFSRGSTVLIKPNLLSNAPPERGINTHPEVIRAAIRLVRELGAKPVVAELPGIGPESCVKEAVQWTKAVCDEEGVEFRLFNKNGFRKVEVNGRIVKELHLPVDILEADHIVNLPKLKTHMLTILTGAVKNLFGCLPFSQRKQLHGYGAKDEFAHALLDILSVVKPDISIFDAVVAMEGRGPSDGRLANLNCIIAGADAVATDVVACWLAGWDANEVKHLAFAKDRGLGTFDIDGIEIVGKEELKPSNLAPPPTSMGIARNAPAWTHRIIYGLWKVQPKVIKGRCTGCGTCADACPTGAIRIVDGRARIARDLCIECFCCKELCPSHAIGEKFGPVTYVRELMRRFQKRVPS